MDTTDRSIRVAQYHSKNKRELMEDSALALTFEYGVQEVSSSLRAVLMVADGMGGLDAGEKASQLSINVLQSYLMNHLKGDILDSATVTQTMKSGFAEANAVVKKRSAEGGKNKPLGTTLTCCLVVEGNLILGHVGDSAAFLVRGTRAKRLTEDQSVGNALTGAIGILDSVDCQAGYLALESGDVVILATDGLTKGLNEQNILQIVHGTADINAACVDLVHAAEAAGVTDNISVVAMEYGALDRQPVGMPAGVPPRPRQSAQPVPATAAAGSETAPAPAAPRPASRQESSAGFNTGLVIVLVGLLLAMLAGLGWVAVELARWQGGAPPASPANERAMDWQRFREVFVNSGFVQSATGQELFLPLIEDDSLRQQLSQGDLPPRSAAVEAALAPALERYTSEYGDISGLFLRATDTPVIPDTATPVPPPAEEPSPAETALPPPTVTPSPPSEASIPTETPVTAAQESWIKPITNKQTTIPSLGPDDAIPNSPDYDKVNDSHFVQEIQLQVKAKEANTYTSFEPVRWNNRKQHRFALSGVFGEAANTITPRNHGVYQWQILGNPGRSSEGVLEAGEFVYYDGNKPPESPVILEPSPDQAFHPGTIEATWSAPSDPEGDQIHYYRIHVSGGSGHALPGKSSSQTSASIDPPQQGWSPGAYVLTVTAFDEFGAESEPATRGFVIIEPTPTPTLTPTNTSTPTATQTPVELVQLVSPEDGSTIDGEAGLQWKLLRNDTKISAVNVEVAGTVVELRATDTSISLSEMIREKPELTDALTYGDTHEWKVSLEDSRGRALKLGYSSEWAFVFEPNIKVTGDTPFSHLELGGVPVEANPVSVNAPQEMNLSFRSSFHWDWSISKNDRAGIAIGAIVQVTPFAGDEKTKTSRRFILHEDAAIVQDVDLFQLLAKDSFAIEDSTVTLTLAAFPAAVNEEFLDGHLRPDRPVSKPIVMRVDCRYLQAGTKSTRGTLRYRLGPDRRLYLTSESPLFWQQGKVHIDGEAEDAEDFFHYRTDLHAGKYANPVAPGVTLREMMDWIEPGTVVHWDIASSGLGKTESLPDEFDKLPIVIEEKDYQTPLLATFVEQKAPLIDASTTLLVITPREDTGLGGILRTRADKEFNLNMKPVREKENVTLRDLLGDKVEPLSPGEYSLTLTNGKDREGKKLETAYTLNLKEGRLPASTDGSERGSP